MRECVKPLQLIVKDRSASLSVTVSACGSKPLISAASSPQRTSPACQMKMERWIFVHVQEAGVDISAFFSKVLTKPRTWDSSGSPTWKLLRVIFCFYFRSVFTLLTSHLNPSVLSSLIKCCKLSRPSCDDWRERGDLEVSPLFTFRMKNACSSFLPTQKNGRRLTPGCTAQTIPPVLWGCGNILKVITAVLVQLMRKCFQTYLRVPSVPSWTFLPILTYF